MSLEKTIIKLVTLVSNLPCPRTTIIGLFADLWMPHLTFDFATKNYEDLHRWIFIVYVFERPNEFQEVTRSLTVKGNAENVQLTVELATPTSICGLCHLSHLTFYTSIHQDKLTNEHTEAIQKERINVMEMLYRQVSYAIASYQDVGTQLFCTPHDEKHNTETHRARCDAMVLGSLIRSAKQQSLYPRPMEPYHGESIQSVRDKIFNLTVKTLCESETLFSAKGTGGGLFGGPSHGSASNQGSGPKDWFNPFAPSQPPSSSLGFTPNQPTGSIFGPGPGPRSGSGSSNNPIGSNASASNQRSSSIFGAAPNRSSSGLFTSTSNQPSSNPFSSTSNQPSLNLFGPPPNQPSGGFFGTTSNQPSVNLFGPPPNQPLNTHIGATSTQPSGSLFGSTPNQACGGLFGSSIRYNQAPPRIVHPNVQDSLQGLAEAILKNVKGQRLSDYAHLRGQ